MNQVSTCPQCGAPIYLTPPDQWEAPTKPPQATFTCECRLSPPGRQMMSRRVPSQMPGQAPGQGAPT
jgi:hypothetical protein